MNKKYKIIIGAIVILVLIAVGYFYYVKKEEAKMGPVSFDSFKKQEVNGRTFYENKDVGLTFEVPEGWEVKSDGIASISIVSADFNRLL